MCEAVLESRFVPHAPANHGVCRARSQRCFPVAFRYVFISSSLKKIKKLYLPAFWRWRRGLHIVQRLPNYPPKKEWKQERGVGKAKGSFCVCAIAVRGAKVFQLFLRSAAAWTRSSPTGCWNGQKLRLRQRLVRPRPRVRAEIWLKQGYYT